MPRACKGIDRLEALAAVGDLDEVVRLLPKVPRTAKRFNAAVANVLAVATRESHRPVSCCVRASS